MKNHRLKILICVSIILSLQFSTFNGLRAQLPWTFTSIEDACLDDAYLVQPTDELVEEIAAVAVGNVEYNAIYHVSGPYSIPQSHFLFFDIKPTDYIRFQNLNADFSIPEETAVKLLPWLVSRSYWQQRFDVVRSWGFVSIEGLQPSGSTDTRSYSHPATSSFSPISWLGFHFQPSVEWPVYFSIALGGGEPQTLTLSDMEQLAQRGAFATYADWQRYNDEDDATWRRHNEMFATLQHHFDSLSNVSSRLDRHADSMLTALQSDSMAAARQQSHDEVDRLKKRMNRDEIFFMSINPAKSDYMFGLEFNLFNCFQKTITKIEITVTPYNDRSKVQVDKFGRSTRTVRCMGPVYPGSPAQYSFDELYWNDQGKIKFMRVTGIVFHFTDGTTKSYSGYNKIMKHCLR